MRFGSFFLAAALAAGLSGAMYADHDDDDRAEHHYRDRDDNRDYRYSYGNDAQAGFNDGMARGQYDASRGLRYQPKEDGVRHASKEYKRAFRDGYQQGYRNYSNNGRYAPYANRYPGNTYPYGNNYPYPNGNNYPYPYGNNYPYSNSYPYGSADRGYRGNEPYQAGFNDGVLDGRRDLQTGHSYRPQQMDNYKHADRGYDSIYGNKDQYKSAYRNGYLAGYQRGYQNR